MISTSDFKKGMKILFRNEPYIIVDFAHVKQSMRAAFVRTRMKNLLTGLIHEETFRSGEKFEQPDLAYREMLYLYKDNEFYYFMDQKTYDQYQFSPDQIAEIADYLKEQGKYTILYFNEKPVAATPPLFVELAVIETQPGIRGDTAQGGATKPAKLETGLVLQVPLFVSEGDVIKVDTRSNEYVERIK